MLLLTTFSNHLVIAAKYCLYCIVNKLGLYQGRRRNTKFPYQTTTTLSMSKFLR